MSATKRRQRYEVVYLTDDGWKRHSQHRKREKADESLSRLREFYEPLGVLASHRTRIVDNLVIDAVSNTGTRPE